jgi:alkylhydroperoxidase/carboxymuconolactone decarboxylase family protein YurZ
MDVTGSRERIAWVDTPTDEEIRARMQPGARNPYDFGFVPHMRRLLMAHEVLGPAFTDLFRQVMFGPGSLDRREREMVACVAAAAQDCHY